jgi:hypothetical protein
MEVATLPESRRLTRPRFYAALVHRRLLKTRALLKMNFFSRAADSWTQPKSTKKGTAVVVAEENKSALFRKIFLKKKNV